MDHRLAEQKLLTLATKIDDTTYEIFKVINPYVQRVKYLPTILFVITLIAYAVWYHILR